MNIPLLTFVGIAIVVLATFPLIVAAVQVIIAGFSKFRYLKGLGEPNIVRVAVLIPAWNEALVLTASVERMLALNYPKDALRIYVVDDASTDDTPDVMTALIDRFGDQVQWLRRDQGGEGKAHTLNHGLAQIEESDWAEAVLITDADVLFTPDSLLRMVRHFADEKVGAVTAYVKEGSVPGGYINRFIAYEYATAQAVARRAWNVIGSQMCLAGGAQLLRRSNLEQIGFRIDTTTLAEDTVTTMETQLAGNTVVFEPNALVWAEEPNSIRALWGQRLRWGRGNVQVSLRYKHMWGHWRKYPRVGSPFFAAAWFAVILQPLLMFAATAALVTLYFSDDVYAFFVFRWLWIFSGLIYLLIIIGVAAADPRTLKRTWVEGILYPGIITTMFVWISLFPSIAHQFANWFFHITHATESAQSAVIEAYTLGLYTWLTVSVLFAYLAKVVEKIPKVGRILAEGMLWLAGYGPLLCAVTTAAIVTHVRRSNTVWVKTVKEGNVQIGADRRLKA